MPATMSQSLVGLGRMSPTIISWKPFSFAAHYFSDPFVDVGLRWYVGCLFSWCLNSLNTLTHDFNLNCLFFLSVRGQERMNAALFMLPAPDWLNGGVQHRRGWFHMYFWEVNFHS